MYLKSRMLYLYTETPLHAGAGFGLGAVDLPIQRERSTGYPIVQASGLKGALRSEIPEGDADSEERKKHRAVFGPDWQHADDHAGAFAPGDARILLFPVRSLKGVFAWTTSLLALRRWQREAVNMGLIVPPLPDTPPQQSQCYATHGVVLDDRRNQIVLEEFTYEKLGDPTTENKNIITEVAKGLSALLPDALDGYWKTQIQEKLVILPDDDFRDFVTHATEVLTRIRLEPDTKTVAHGALWTEEHLPVDTLLYAPVRATRLRIDQDQFPTDWAEIKSNPDGQAKAVLDFVQNSLQSRLQLGGDETVGRGIVGLKWS